MRDATDTTGGIHHVAMTVHDFDATLRFYVEGLGFRKAYAWGEDGRAEGKADGRAAFLDAGDGSYLEIFAGGQRPPDEVRPEGAWAHIALRAADCDAALARARAAGGRVTMEPQSIPVAGDPPTTVRIAFAKGPDNEVIEFFQNDLL